MALSNWSGEHRFAPRHVHRPRGRAAIAAAVRAAAARGATLRPMGSGHSWTALCASDEELLLLDQHDRALMFDYAARTATVEGGMRLYDLNRALDAHGLAMPNLGSIDRQTIAGVLSTATHGTGARLGNLSTFITELELVDGRGDLRRCSRSRDAELFAAARCGLGALGVICSVTLACQPAFRLHSVEEVTSIDWVLDALDELVDDNDHFKLWWIPRSDRCLIYRQNRTGQPVARSRLRKLVDQRLVRGPIYGALLSAAARSRRAAAAVTDLIWQATPRRVQYVDASYRVLSFPVEVRHHECEYAIDRRHAAAALRRIRAHVERSDLEVNMPIEVRFVRADDIWLSPAYRRDSCYICPTMALARDYSAYFSQVEALLADFDARPHWGKTHGVPPARLAELYPRFADFLAVRERLDPDGVFLSPYMRRLLGL
ncbi:MAG: FAD-binding protein [Myxococcales bacterium]|nr:FAD-binding protein [Myxococcales bacterium]